MRRVGLYALFALGGLITVAVIAFVVLGGLYRAPSESMEPTVHRGDRFAVLKFGAPDGGDRISMRGGQIVRNGKRETTDGPRACTGAPCDFPDTVEVPKGHFFMLGDNRGASDDSRFWGPVPEGWVIGRYWFRVG
jgi:signal peptidase I